MFVLRRQCPVMPVGASQRRGAVRRLAWHALAVMQSLGLCRPPTKQLLASVVGAIIDVDHRGREKWIGSNYY